MSPGERYRDGKGRQVETQERHTLTGPVCVLDRDRGRSPQAPRRNAPPHRLDDSLERLQPPPPQRTRGTRSRHGAQARSQKRVFKFFFADKEPCTKIARAGICSFFALLTVVGVRFYLFFAPRDATEARRAVRCSETRLSRVPLPASRGPPVRDICVRDERSHLSGAPTNGAHK